MSIQRYRRKPDPGDREDQVAARYEPGMPLNDLLAVARKADADAELAEVVFPSGTVLLVRWERVPDDHPSEIEYETVEPGEYLAHSSGRDSLYGADEANWRQFYDLVPDGEQR